MAGQSSNVNENAFLNALKREFTISELFEKFGGRNASQQYDYIKQQPLSGGNYDYFDRLPYTGDPLPGQQPYVGDYPNQPYIGDYPNPNHYQPYRPFTTTPITPTPEREQPYRIDRMFNEEMERILREYQQDREAERMRRAQERTPDELERLRGIFSNPSEEKKVAKKEAMKSAFLNVIRDRINFDDNGNLVDESGEIIKSIGQFGLMFIRILNEALEGRKSHQENEEDMKKIFE